MSDFILDYDILEAIAKNSNLLGKRSEEYAESLESKIINALENVTGASSGYLASASDSIRDKINALKLKSEAFYHFAEQILNLLEVAEQIDQEVADAIAAGREYFLEHHESLRIDDWQAKLLGLYVELKNSIPLLGTIADILGGIDALFESLKDSIKHWYECEGGKYIVDIIKAYAEYSFAVGLLALSVLAFSLPITAVFAVCGVIGASIGIINSATNIVTSYRAAFAAIDENPAWAMIYGKQNSLSDVLRQTNFGNGVFNDLSNLSAGAIDITETVCVIVGFAEMGAGIAKLFKGEAFKLLKNKGALNLSGLKSSIKNGILDLKSSIKQGYKDFKSGFKGAENVENASKDTSGVIKGGSGAKYDNINIDQLKESNMAELENIINDIRKNGNSPIDIPDNATVISKSMNKGYQQIKYKWSDGTYTYESRWHTETPGAAKYDRGTTWVVTRTIPGNATGQVRVTEYLVGGTWVDESIWKAAERANMAGTATQKQMDILEAGHWLAK